MKLKKNAVLCLISCLVLLIISYTALANFNGDLNGDKKIDSNDLNDLYKHFNTGDQRYDLNGDGVVDIYDMSYYERNMGVYSLDTEHTGVLGITRTFVLYFRPEPRYDSTSSILVPIGSKVYIHNRTGDFYKVTYVDKDKRILNGFITRYVDIIRDDDNNSFLGVLSELYESNGDPECISKGQGDLGGKSYGAWQLSSKMGAVDSFLIWLKDVNRGFYDSLDQARKADETGPGSFGENFDSAWKNIASSNYDEFLKIQQYYIKTRYYDDLINRLSKQNSNLEQLSKFSTRNVLWSLAVQHGPTGAQRLINNSLPPQDHEGFIEAIYSERSKVDVYFFSSPTLHYSLKNRFNNEKNDALRILKLENEL